jgi:hypothetical protein
MPLLIPVSTNYPDLLTPVPAVWNKTPIEGVKHIGGAINWSTMGGSGKTVSLNPGGNAAAPISHIAAITVDNSQSGADVLVIFPDTQQTIPVPAYQAGTFPVFTTGTQFYMSAPNALSVDRTNFVVHNSVPPHSNVPKTEFQNVAISEAITMVNGTTQIIPVGITGSISGVNIQAQGGAVAGWGASITLQDGNASKVFFAQCGGNNNYVSQTIIDQTNVQVRFQNGLQGVVFVNGAPTGQFNVNVLYRTP